MKKNLAQLEDSWNTRANNMDSALPAAKKRSYSGGEKWMCWQLPDAWKSLVWDKLDGEKKKKQQMWLKDYGKIRLKGKKQNKKEEVQRKNLCEIPSHEMNAATKVRLTSGGRRKLQLATL